MCYRVQRYFLHGFGVMMKTHELVHKDEEHTRDHERQQSLGTQPCGLM
jgi:hypothetical protein